MSNHNFIKEVTKEKPLDKKKLLIKAGLTVVAAVLFGVIAAVVFAYINPLVTKEIESRKAPDEINIIGDDEEITPPPAAKTPEPTPTPRIIQEAEATPEPTTPELGVAEYKKLNQDMRLASEKAEKSIVTVIGIKSDIDYFNNAYDSKGQLSGIIIANNGRELLVLTEYQVVDGVDKIQVTFVDGKTVDAKYQKHDENTGLTIIKILLEDVGAETLEKIVMAPLGNSNKLSQGEPVIALGSPSGHSDSIAFGATTSVTNKVSSWDTEYNIITTDIMGSADGSGVLLDLDGQIVGIIAQNYSNENNTVTVLAISPIRALIQTLSNNGAIRVLGISGNEVTADISEKTGIPEGIFIGNPKQDSPAMRAGLMSGDVIIAVNDNEVETLADYSEELGKCPVGEQAKLTVMRRGADGYEEIVFDVTVEAL